jgi:hypothetical protein
MFKEKNFNNFIGKMEEGIVENNKYYDDAWKKEDIKFLEHRLQLKFKEFQTTGKPCKLVSLANLAMMVHVRHNEDN